MSDSIVIQGEIDEGVDPTFYALIVGPDGQVIGPNDVAVNGVVLNIYDRSSRTPDAVVSGPTTLNPSTAYNGFPLVSSSIQTTGWNKNADGYVFRYLVPSSTIPGGFAGGHTYRVEFKLTLVPTNTPTLGSGILRVPFDLNVRPMWS